MWMSFRPCGQACFLLTLISGGRADGADATDSPLQGSLASGEAGGHSESLPRTPWSSYSPL